MPRYKCWECRKSCELVTVWYKEKDEFWGAPCWRDVAEDVSDCCNAELEEIDEDESE